MSTLNQEFPTILESEQIKTRFNTLPFPQQMLLTSTHSLIDCLERFHEHQIGSFPYQDTYIKQYTGDHIPKELLTLEGLLKLIDQNLFSNNQTLSSVFNEHSISLKQRGVFIYWAGLSNTAQWLHEGKWRTYKPFVGWLTQNPSYLDTPNNIRPMTTLTDLAQKTITKTKLILAEEVGFEPTKP